MVLDLLKSHAAPIAWALLTFVLTALFKPRTPAQYAALPPRVAALLKFLGAFGVDAPSLIDALKQLASGEMVPPDVVRARQEQAFAPPSATAMVLDSDAVTPLPKGKP